MVDAAQYIYRKLKEEHLITRAFNCDKDRGTQSFDLICVGHSLGAGTASILAIMLRQEYPRTRCFAYSPPGGTLRYGYVPFYDVGQTQITGPETQLTTYFSLLQRY